MRAQDDAGYIEPVLAVLRTNEAQFTSIGFARGLEALAWLARNEENKDAVREFLVSHVNSLKRRVQLGAINGLGTLGDTKAIGVIEKLASTPKEAPERAAAERALTSLRDGRKPSVEFGNLRGEVQTLQRENRELRKDLDDLKKKLDTLSAAPTTVSEKESKSKSPAKGTKKP
jgi:HEAT repeat protein